MLVLAIDTSALDGSVALVSAPKERPSTVIAERTARVSNAHGQSLLPMIEAVLSDAGVSLAAVELLAVGIGPGSFTGTRVAVATAKGLAIGTSIPLRGVDSFVALAAEVDVDSSAPAARIVALIDARKAEIYAAAVDRTTSDAAVVGAPMHIAPAAIDLSSLGADRAAAWVGDGVGWVATAQGIALACAFGGAPRARTIAKVAAARQHAAHLDEVDTLEPLYVRPPDITMPKRPPHVFSKTSSF